VSNYEMGDDLFSQWLVVGFVGSRFENRLDGLAEELGNAEGKRQAGIAFASFNGIHGLERKVLKSSPRRTISNCCPVSKKPSVGSLDRVRRRRTRRSGVRISPGAPPSCIVCFQWLQPLFGFELTPSSHDGDDQEFPAR
jgi:hypothetical protein